MSLPGSVQRVRRAWIIFGTVVLLALVAVAGILAAGNRSTPADVAYMGPVGDAPGDPGIYRYDTIGFESVDALAGARHEYPEVTELILEDLECGPVVRWTPLEERREEWTWCGPGGSVATIVEYHAWFGVGETTETTCEGLHFTADDLISWEASCTRPETEISIVVEFRGRESLMVGSVSLDTVRFRLIEETTGRTEGIRVTDLWLIPGTPLPAKKQVADRSASSSPIGDVTYVEEYTLLLRSTAPSR